MLKSDDLIKMATTEVNGKICLNPAYDVREKDIVRYDGQKIEPIKVECSFKGITGNFDISSWQRGYQV